MKLNRYHILSICFVFSVGFIWMLFISSNRTNHYKNGFIRLFPPHLLHSPKILDIRYNSYYIAGGTSKNIYLGNVTAPAHLLTTNYELTDSQSVNMRIINVDSIAWNGALTYVDSPNIYLLENVSPLFFKGEISNFRLTGIKMKSKAVFASHPISPTSIVMKVYDYKYQKNILIKNMINKDSVLKKIDILLTQGDGVFSTDGILTYEANSSKLLYVYYYRNEFICLDTNLSILYKGRTIDTNTVAKIKIAKIKSSGKETFASPPLFVNAMASVSAGKLFINSALMANNEEKRAFNDASVIDVYSVEKGHYLYSFYIPKHFRDRKLKNFKVYNNTVIAIYDHYLLNFAINNSVVQKIE